MSLDEVHPCRRPLPKVDQKFIKMRSPKKSLFYLQNGRQIDPQGHPKSLKLGPNASQAPSRMSLETRSGKSRLLHLPRDPLMCSKHSPCHAFDTSPKLPPGSLWLPFWSIWNLFWAPWAPKKRPRIEKQGFPKHIKKRHQKNALESQK